MTLEKHFKWSRRYLVFWLYWPRRVRVKLEPAWQIAISHVFRRWILGRPSHHLTLISPTSVLLRSSMDDKEDERPWEDRPLLLSTHFWFPALWHSISGPGLLGSKADLVGLTGDVFVSFMWFFFLSDAQNKSEGRSSATVPSLIESYRMILLMDESTLWVRKSLRNI